MTLHGTPTVAAFLEFHGQTADADTLAIESDAGGPVGAALTCWNCWGCWVAPAADVPQGG